MPAQSKVRARRFPRGRARVVEWRASSGDREPLRTPPRSGISSRTTGAADHWTDQLDTPLHLRAAQRLLGRTCDERAPRIRCFPFGRYPIAALPIGDGIDAMRVLTWHSGRRYGVWLPNPPAATVEGAPGLGDRRDVGRRCCSKPLMPPRPKCFGRLDGKTPAGSGAIPWRCDGRTSCGVPGQLA